MRNENRKKKEKGEKKETDTPKNITDTVRSKGRPRKGRQNAPSPSQDGQL